MSSPKDMFKFADNSNMTDGFFIPNPERDSAKQTIATLVNAARNALGQMIGQKIGRDQTKVELKWAWMSVDDWSQILVFLNINFVFYVSYYDAKLKTRHIRQFYVGDRSAIPEDSDFNGNVTSWIDLTLDIVDTGISG